MSLILTHTLTLTRTRTRTRTRTQSSIINNKLDLPPNLIRSDDVGRSLRLIMLGAANEQHAGQWFMGLQGLRESPETSIESLCLRRWRMWQQSHVKYLLKSVRALRVSTDLLTS